MLLSYLDVSVSCVVVSMLFFHKTGLKDKNDLCRNILHIFDFTAFALEMSCILTTVETTVIANLVNPLT